MGIIIAPLFLAMITIYFTCLSKINTWRKNKQIETHHILGGLFIALILYANIYYPYSVADSVPALGIYLKIPITSFILPFIVLVILRFIKKPWSTILVKSIAISIVITGTLGTIFNSYYFGLLETLDVNVYY